MADAIRSALTDVHVALTHVSEMMETGLQEEQWHAMVAHVDAVNVLTATYQSFISMDAYEASPIHAAVTGSQPPYTGPPKKAAPVLVGNTWVSPGHAAKCKAAPKGPPVKAPPNHAAEQEYNKLHAAEVADRPRNKAPPSLNAAPALVVKEPPRGLLKSHYAAACPAAPVEEEDEPEDGGTVSAPVSVSDAFFVDMFCVIVVCFRTDTRIQKSTRVSISSAGACV
jgi:hypothetical protein